VSTDSPIPSSWYYCADSSEIAPGHVIRRKFFGQDLAFWRTESGILHVSHSVCPHRGSDLVQLGSVKGETLQCFSHDYTFNGDGDCVETGQGSLPCQSKDALRQFPVHEIGTFVLVWFDIDGEEPTWKIPDHIFSFDRKGPFVKSQFEFRCAVETINEDNFDVGHLYKWHELSTVDSTIPKVDGHTISVVHDFKRHSILFDHALPGPLRHLPQEISSRYGSTLYGHGLTFSFIDLDAFDFHVQDFIFATPINTTKTLYTTFLRRVLPATKETTRAGLLRRLLHPILFRMFVYRLRREHLYEGHQFWENQHRVENPIITDGEREMLEPYWEWCRQFKGSPPPQTRPQLIGRTKGLEKR